MKVPAAPRRFLLRCALLVIALAIPVTPAGATTGGYAVHAWAGCPGGYNSGTWDDAGRVYVPCGSPSRIGIYDTSARLIETIPVNRFVSDVAPTRDGRYLYLAGPDGPARLVRDATGTWVVDAWRPAAYSLWGRQFTPGGHFVATDAADNVYYADGVWAANSTHTVVKYAPDGRVITRFGEWARTWNLGTFYWALGGLAVSDDGTTVYTVELGNNRVQQWDRAGDGSYAVTRSIGGTDANNADRAGYCDYEGWIGKFAAPYDLGIDRAGNIYVINTTCKQVLKFSPGFGELLANLDVRIGVDYPRPHGLAVGADGTVYVGENQRVLRPAGGAVPADGKPPVQPAPTPSPTPTSQTTSPDPATPPGAVVPPTAVSPAVPTARRDVTPPRLTVFGKARVLRRGSASFVRVRVRCSERCLFEAFALRSHRLVSRRAVWLRPNRVSTVTLRLGRTPRRAGIVTVELSASDARGNEATSMRRARG